MLKVSAHRAAFRHFVPNKRFLGTQKSLTFHAPMLLFMCTHVFEPNLCTAPSTITTTNINDYLIARAYFVNRRDSKCMRFFFGWLCSWSNENRWARRVNALAFYVDFAFKLLFERKKVCCFQLMCINQSQASWIHSTMPMFHQHIGILRPNLFLWNSTVSRDPFVVVVVVVERKI